MVVCFQEFKMEQVRSQLEVFSYIQHHLLLDVFLLRISRHRTRYTTEIIEH
jgi:hypothetical protein